MQKIEWAQWLKMALCSLLAGALLLVGSAMASIVSEDKDSEAVYMESDVAEGTYGGEMLLDAGEFPEYVPLLLDMAIGELGYTEGPNNLTKYGEWNGDPNAAWCAEFLCWCVQQVDDANSLELLTKVYPHYSGQNTGRDWFITQGRFVYRKGNCPGWGYQWILGGSQMMKKNDYIPRPGDWVFFSYNEAGDTEHVAMIEYTARDTEGNIILHVIEGNNPSSVQRNRYYLDNSQVLGFGTPVRRVGTTMRSGNQGEGVLNLQENLHELGFLAEQHKTGTYGGNTKSAVVAFQKTMEGKSATGIADMETQIAIANLIVKKQFNAAETWLVTE